MNLISLPPCNGPFAFSQRKRGSKWVPPAHLLHYLEPGSQPQAWGGDRAPLSSGWREGGPESWATKVSKRECFEEALPFLRLRLSSCHPSGILLWWDRGVLASYLLCVLSSFLSPPPPPVCFLYSPLYELYWGYRKRHCLVWSQHKLQLALEPLSPT